MDETEVIREIAKNKAWSESAARLCVRAGFKCEYCDLDFLESPITYKQIQFDHIVPKRSGGPDSEDNLAAVCRT
jgi:5-methylcytosine-specific restriction endonuclease McrA